MVNKWCLAADARGHAAITVKDEFAETPPHPDRIFDAIRPLPAGGERRKEASGRHTNTDRARHAGAAEAAIARRILGEVLLVIVLGEVERA